ncbi:MAG: hypothetical protein AAF229_06520 [Pseudomonadota bacterium]
MNEGLRRVSAFCAVAALLLQAAFAPGYMPASLAHGQLASLCPSGLPMSWRMVLFGESRDHHDHHDHHENLTRHVEASELCEFAATAAVGPILIIAPLWPAPRRAAPPNTQRAWTYAPRALRGFSARAPPSPV